MKDIRRKSMAELLCGTPYRCSVPHRGVSQRVNNCYIQNTIHINVSAQIVMNDKQ